MSITAVSGCPVQGMTLCTPLATKGAASAVAAPASPVLGVCSIKGQSGAGMVHMFLSGSAAQVVKS